MIWSVHKGIKFSYCDKRKKLFTEPAKGGMDHKAIHVKHNLPVSGPEFDAVVRGRVLMTQTYKVIEVISLGRYEHTPNHIYNAILDLYGLARDTEVMLLEPKWNDEPLPLQKLPRTGD
jgi:hypothetical protein